MGCRSLDKRGIARRSRDHTEPRSRVPLGGRGARGRRLKVVVLWRAKVVLCVALSSCMRRGRPLCGRSCLKEGGAIVIDLEVQGGRRMLSLARQGGACHSGRRARLGR